MISLVRHSLLLLVVLCTACAGPGPGKDKAVAADSAWQLSEAEWRERLPQEAYHVLREEGTERAFTSSLLNIKQSGVYICAGCGEELFRSSDKFDSGTGWPSFVRPYDDQGVAQRVDRRFGIARTEVHCRRCGGHLGHVFEDGPPPTGLRYCINGVSLQFRAVPEEAGP